MSRYLRLIWLGLGMGAFAVLIGLFLLPTHWQVERARVIAAPPEAIFPHLDELRAWDRWSPWRENAYPGLVFHYAGPPRGAGAEVSWNSEATGDGRLRIEQSTSPRMLSFSMTFQHGRVDARDTLHLEPLAGGRTRLTWIDQGSLGHSLLGRLSLPVIEKSMGRDLERGLAGLAVLVEGGSPPAPTPAPSPVASATPPTAAAR